MPVGPVIATVGNVVSGAGVVAFAAVDGPDVLPACVEGPHRVLVGLVGRHPVSL